MPASPGRTSAHVVDALLAEQDGRPTVGPGSGSLRTESPAGAERRTLLVDTDRARRRGPSAAAALLLLAVLAAAPALGQNATGEPTISGVHRVGEELTAATDAIADPDGIIGATFAYRWIRVDASSVETDIASATSSTYTLAGADEGGQVKVRASFTDDAGNPEARTSAAFPASGSVLESCALPPYHPSFGVELLAATMTVGDYFGTFYGYDSGGNLDNYGDLSQKTFDRPDGEPADYRAEPTRERTVITIYNYPGTGVYFAFEPGWTPPVNPSPGKTVLWVCDEVYAFFGSNEVTITEDYFQVGASVRDEDWSMLANPGGADLLRRRCAGVRVGGGRGLVPRDHLQRAGAEFQ